MSRLSVFVSSREAIKSCHHFQEHFLTFAGGMRLCSCLSMFVCLSVCCKVMNGFWVKFLIFLGRSQRTSRVDFGGDPKPNTEFAPFSLP